MTTIAYRAGIMAADTRAYSGNSTPIGQKDKICFNKGELVAVTSRYVGLPAAVLDWWCEGCPDGSEGLKNRIPLVDGPGFYMLAVRPNGEATFMNGCGLPSVVNAPFYTIGSGEDFALGAMEMGASAEEALRVACKLDPYSEPPIQLMGHQGPMRIGE